MIQVDLSWMIHPARMYMSLMHQSPNVPIPCNTSLHPYLENNNSSRRISLCVVCALSDLPVSSTRCLRYRWTHLPSLDVLHDFFLSSDGGLVTTVSVSILFG